MIYLDDHATTPVDPRVANTCYAQASQRILHYMTTEFGNASSIDHAWGDRPTQDTMQANPATSDPNVRRHLPLLG